MSQPNLATDRKDLSDRTVFVLNQTQWDTFVALLNARGSRMTRTHSGAEWRPSRAEGGERYPGAPSP